MGNNWRTAWFFLLCGGVFAGGESCDSEQMLANALAPPAGIDYRTIATRSWSPERNYDPLPPLSQIVTHYREPLRMLSPESLGFDIEPVIVSLVREENRELLVRLSGISMYWRERIPPEFHGDVQEVVWHLEPTCPGLESMEIRRQEQYMQRMFVDAIETSEHKPACRLLELLEALRTATGHTHDVNSAAYLMLGYCSTDYYPITARFIALHTTLIVMYKPGVCRPLVGFLAATHVLYECHAMYCAAYEALKSQIECAERIASNS